MTPPLTADQQLKPCPFCGGSAKVDWFGFGELCEIVCEDRDCGATGPCRKDDVAAVAAWNAYGCPAHLDEVVRLRNEVEDLRAFVALSKERTAALAAMHGIGI